MKFLSFLFLSSFLITLHSCSSKDSGFKHELLYNYTNSDKGIIISCIRCNCVIEGLKDYFAIDENAKNIPIFSDSICMRNSGLQNIHQISQAMIDSIYERNYNLILFKKNKKSFSFKLITTKEGYDIPKIAKSFFSN